MGAVTTVFVRKVIEAAESEVDTQALMESVGLEPGSAVDVAHMISDVAYYGLLERIARSISDPTGFPLRVGASMQCDDYGAFGFAWKTAPTLRVSIARAERYWRLLTSVSEYELQHHENSASFILNRSGERRLGLRLSNENSLASVVSIIREVSPVPFYPLKVQFKHAPPEQTGAHTRYFGCECDWETELDAITISSEHLGMSNRKGDDALSRFFADHLDQELQQILRDETVGQLVRNAIAGSLSEGVPKAATIARRLGLGERTLQRRKFSGTARRCQEGAGRKLPGQQRLFNCRDCFPDRVF